MHASIDPTVFATLEDPSPEGGGSPARLLREAHERLEADFANLCERARSGDWRECDEVWGWFSRDLEAHLALEEERYFTAYLHDGPEAPGVVAALRADHEVIRAALAEIGVDIQLHTIRADRVDRFVAALRAHAEREDRTIHAWLEAREEAGERPPI